MKIKTIIKVLALLGPLATFAPQGYETGIKTLAKLTSYKFLSTENEVTIHEFIRREKESATNLVEDISSPEARTENETSPLVVPSQTEIQPTIETEKDGLESIYTDAMQLNDIDSVIFILQLKEIPAYLQNFMEFRNWEKRKNFAENLKKTSKKELINEKNLIEDIYSGIKKDELSDLSLLIKIIGLTSLIKKNQHQLLSSKFSEYLKEPNKERGESSQSKAKFCGVVGFCLEILSFLVFSLQTNNPIPGIPTNSTLNRIPALKAMWCLTLPLKPEQCLDLYIGQGTAGIFLLVSGYFYVMSCLYQHIEKPLINENDRKLYAQLATLHALLNKEKYLEDSSRCNKLFSNICSGLSSCCSKICCLICCKNKKRPIFRLNFASLNPCEEIPIYEVMDEIAFKEERKDQLEVLENPEIYLPKGTCNEIGSYLHGCIGTGRRLCSQLNSRIHGCTSSCWKKVSSFIGRKKSAKDRIHPENENENSTNSVKEMI